MSREGREGKALLLLSNLGFSPQALGSLQTDSRVGSDCNLDLSWGKAQGGLMYSTNLLFKILAGICLGLTPGLLPDLLQFD